MNQYDMTKYLQNSDYDTGCMKDSSG